MSGDDNMHSAMKEILGTEQLRANYCIDIQMDWRGKVAGLIV